MGHQFDRCDFIDMLEESAKFHRPLTVTLKGNAHFSETVRDLVTEDGADYVIFRDHGRVAVIDILACAWNAPRPEGYDSKL